MLNARNISSSVDAAARAAATGTAAAPSSCRGQVRSRGRRAASRGRFSVMPPPVMCAMPLIQPRSSSGPIDRQIRPVRAQERVADRLAELRPRGCRRRAPARRTRSGARANTRSCAGPTTAAPISASPASMSRAVDDARARHDADDEPGDVVFAVGVEPRHLGGLAAEQRAAVLAAGARHARDDLLGDVGRQPAGRQVVEKEQRPRALHEDVVDAVIDEVGADRVVHAGHERDLELGADAVGAGDEHRVRRRPVEREQPAERSDARQHAGRVGAARERLDAPHGFVAGVDVDARLAVVDLRHQNSSFSNQRFGHPAPRRVRSARPSSARRISAKNRSSSKSSDSMSKRVEQQLERSASTILAASRARRGARSGCRSATSRTAEGDRLRAPGRCAGAPASKQRRRAPRRCPAHGQHAERRATRSRSSG